MKFLAINIALLLFISCNHVGKVPVRTPISFENVDNQRVHIFSGTGEEIGAQRAEVFGERAENLMEKWLLPKLSSFPEGYKMALSKVDRMNEFVPDSFKKESTSFSEKSGVDLEQIKLANAIADIIQHVSEENFLGCSSYIVSAERSMTGGMILGRNLDYYQSILLAKEWEAVLFAKEGKNKILSIHLPGVTGVLNAINDKGVAMMIHVSSGPTSSEGIPAIIGFRSVLEKANNLDEAVELIKSLDWTFAMNIIVADGQKSAVVEVDAEKAEARYEEDNVLFATNHFRTQKMMETSGSGAGFRWGEFERLNDAYDKYSIDDMAVVLESVGGFSGQDAESNILAVIIDYGTGKIRVSSDPAGSVKAVNGAREFVIDFKKLFSENR